MVASAEALFREKGDFATRVDEVCQAAGATKGAFFHHLSSKEDVARALKREDIS